MKRVICLFLALVMSISLCACQKKEDYSELALQKASEVFDNFLSSVDSDTFSFPVTKISYTINNVTRKESGSYVVDVTWHITAKSEAYTDRTMAEFTLAKVGSLLIGTDISVDGKKYSLSHTNTDYNDAINVIVNGSRLNGYTYYVSKVNASGSSSSGGSSGSLPGGKCSICNGTGSVKYYYGDSDLQAYLDGQDPYTFGVCTACNGTGKAKR